MKQKRILFVAVLLIATVGFFFFIYQGKLERMNHEWDIKLEGKIAEDISTKPGPHGDCTEYLKIKNANMDYLRNLVSENEVSSKEAIENIKEIIEADLAEESSYDFSSILAEENHFGVLTKDNWNLFLWYSDNTDEVYLLDDIR